MLFSFPFPFPPISNRERTASGSGYFFSSPLICLEEQSPGVLTGILPAACNPQTTPSPSLWEQMENHRADGCLMGAYGATPQDPLECSRSQTSTTESRARMDPTHQELILHHLSAGRSLGKHSSCLDSD